MLTRAALVLVLTGGGVLAQEEESPPAEDAVLSEEVSPEADDAPAEAATPQSLPDCASLPREVDAAALDSDTPVERPLVDCVIDEAGTIVTFAYTGTAPNVALTVTQSAPEGGERLVSDPIPVIGTPQPPALTDRDDDGAFELWVPVAEAGVETLFELWMMREDFFFARSDEIFAVSPEALVARDGLLVLVSPDEDSADRRRETVLFLDETGVNELYTLGIDTAAQTCTLFEAPERATLNGPLIEAECADANGFPQPTAVFDGGTVIDTSPETTRKRDL